MASVIDSRPNPEGRRRRHECGDCGHRFTTQEKMVQPEAG